MTGDLFVLEHSFTTKNKVFYKYHSQQNDRSYTSLNFDLFQNPQLLLLVSLSVFHQFPYQYFQPVIGERPLNDLVHIYLDCSGLEYRFQFNPSGPHAVTKFRNVPFIIPVILICVSIYFFNMNLKNNNNRWTDW